MPRITGSCMLILFGLIASVSIASGQERAALLVTPEWVAQHLQDKNLVLLHVGAKGEYDHGHIPGAVAVAYTSDISLPPEKGRPTLELLPVEQLKANLEKLGISDDSRIVVYFGIDWVSPSTRVIFTLNYMGLGDRTSLLDGGMPAWIAAGHDITTETKAIVPGKLTPHLHPELVVDAAWVAAHLYQPGIAIIDSRESLAFFGTDPSLTSRPNFISGHIPGAGNIPVEAIAEENGHIKGTAALREIFQKAGVKQGEQVVTYCWVGQRATLSWFAAKLLGYDAHLYDGSWEDWTARKEMPIEKASTGTGHI